MYLYSGEKWSSTALYAARRLEASTPVSSVLLGAVAFSPVGALEAIVRRCFGM